MFPMAYLKQQNYIYRPFRRHGEATGGRLETTGDHRGQFSCTAFGPGYGIESSNSAAKTPGSLRCRLYLCTEDYGRLPASLDVDFNFGRWTTSTGDDGLQ